MLLDAGGEYKCASFHSIHLTHLPQRHGSGYASDICQSLLPPSGVPVTDPQFLFCTARTFPVNGTFTPPQRELYAALLATQKALVKECAVARGHSLATLHRRSVDLLRAELDRIGLPCAGPVLERVLYPHYLTHPIGIGESRRLPSFPFGGG